MWREGLKKHFGASSCSKWRQLAADVQCVALGIKPAYLVDSLKPDAVKFCSLLEDVLSPISTLADDDHQTHAGLGVRYDHLQASVGFGVSSKWLSELRVVSVGSDVLLLNWTTVQDMFQNPQSSCIYVDIGKSTDSCGGSRAGGHAADAHISVESAPGIEENCRLWFSQLSKQEDEASHSESDDKSKGVLMCLSTEVPSDLNMCSLFGRLLGYPVVYWFDPAGEYSLDLVDLTNYHVTVSSASHQHSIQHLSLKV